MGKRVEVGEHTNWLRKLQNHAKWAYCNSAIYCYQNTNLTGGGALLRADQCGASMLMIKALSVCLIYDVRSTFAIMEDAGDLAQARDREDWPGRCTL